MGTVRSGLRAAGLVAWVVLAVLVGCDGGSADGDATAGPDGVTDLTDAVTLPDTLTEEVPEDAEVSADLTLGDEVTATLDVADPDIAPDMPDIAPDIEVEPDPTFSLSFDASGGKGQMEPLLLQKGETVTLPVCALTKPGFVFQGWALQAGGAVAYADGASFTMGLQSQVLYAVWDWAIYEMGAPGPSGGLIFFIEGDPVATGWKYMEAAPQSMEKMAEWGAKGTLLQIKSKAVGSGLPNTVLIADWLRVNEPDNVTAGARYCDDLMALGFDDWFLPSFYEVDFMHNNLKKVGLGGFGPGNYMTSNQIDADNSQSYSMKTGDLVKSGKHEGLKFRPARRF
jgi:hypothetical protein